MDKDIKVAIIGLSGKSIFLSVDEFHKPGETVIAKDVHIEPGGKGYNQAACLLKLGAHVSYLTTIGIDDYAKVCYEYLNQYNASLKFIEIDEVKTAVASIITNKWGDNQVTVYQGASSYLSISHLKEFASYIKGANVLLLTLELPLEVVEEAIKIARENNVTIILNPAPYNPNFKLYELCDFIIPNEIEARQIFNLSSSCNILDEAKKIIERPHFNNFKNVIITLGSNGCLLVNKKEITKINGLKVNTVDTTGAGDVFNASFTYFYLKYKDIKKAIHYSNIAAAISTTKKHVLNSLPELEEILAYNQI